MLCQARHAPNRVFTGCARTRLGTFALKDWHSPKPEFTRLVGKVENCSYADPAWQQNFPSVFPAKHAAIAPDTYKLMKGRGGLRIKIISGGKLTCGENILRTNEEITLDPTTPLSKPNLPS